MWVALVCPQTRKLCCIHGVMRKMLCFFNFWLFCLWLVTHVTLSFTDFELEMISSNCSHDAVKILDGDNYQAPSIGTYTVCVFVRAFPKAYAVNNDTVCDDITELNLGNILSGHYCGFEIPHPVTSFSNSLVINFISDQSVSRKGFRATYSASISSKTY